jgi:hypothetical protein
MRIKLKRLHRVESKGRVYYYAWRGGPRINTGAAPGSPAFMQAYNGAVATVRAPTTDKVVSLIKLYKGTTEFTRLSARTQADYLKQIKKIEAKFGKLPLVARESSNARGAFKEWRDMLAKKSLRQADYAWTVLQRIFRWLRTAERSQLIPARGEGGYMKPTAARIYGLTITSNSFRKGARTSALAADACRVDRAATG